MENKEPQALLEGLAASAAEFQARLQPVPPSAWRHRPAPDAWSLTEIVCHLRDVEREVHLERIQRVSAQDNVFLSVADTDHLAETRAYQAQDGPRALHDFLAERHALIEYLVALPPSIWQRTARHAMFGTTRFNELVSLILDHDAAHLDQVGDVLSSL